MSALDASTYCNHQEIKWRHFIQKKSIQRRFWKAADGDVQKNTPSPSPPPTPEVPPRRRRRFQGEKPKTTAEPTLNSLWNVLQWTSWWFEGQNLLARRTKNRNQSEMEFFFWFPARLIDSMLSSSMAQAFSRTAHYRPFLGEKEPSCKGRRRALSQDFPVHQSDTFNCLWYLTRRACSSLGACVPIPKLFY